MSASRRYAAHLLQKQGQQEIRQYESENFQYQYDAYKALHGNSFIDKIKKEVDEWEVVS